MTQGGTSLSNSQSTTTCPYCGDEMPLYNKRHQLRRQCGKPECKRAYERISARERIQRQREQRAPEETTCPYCGDQMPLYNKRGRPRKYCAKPECKRAYKAEYQRGFYQKHPGYYAQFKTPEKHKEQKQRWRKKYPEKYKAQLAELHKKHTVEPRIKEAERLRQSRLPVPCHAESCPLPRGHQVIQLQRAPEPRLFIAGVCPTCGRPFVGSANKATVCYCSTQCQKSARAQRKLARRRNVDSAPYCRTDIFERDGWRCKICGKKVKRMVGVFHPLSPTIDHIVPLAAGGPDTPDNVQCAHRRCNISKGARGGGQLILDV